MGTWPKIKGKKKLPTESLDLFNYTTLLTVLSVLLKHHSASKAVFNPAIFSSEGSDCNNCEDTWKILPSLSNHSVLM